MVNQEHDFKKGCEDEQQIEKELDNFIIELGSLIKKQEKGTFVTNPECLRRIAFVYKAMRHIVRGSGVKISYELNQPFISSGSVTIIGKRINIENPSLFVKAARLANTFEVYPKTNKTVQLDFGFDGLAKKVSE